MRHRKLRYTLDALEPKLSPSDFGLALPPADFAPLPDDGSDPNASDTGSGYPGDFPPFVPIYPVECGPAGPAF